MAKNLGYLVYATTIFAENKKDILYSGQLESNSLQNAMDVFASNVSNTAPDSIVAGWVPEDGLPVLTIQVETGGIGLQREVAVGEGLVDTELPN